MGWDGNSLVARVLKGEELFLVMRENSSSPIMQHLQPQDVHAAQPMSRTHQYRKVMKPLLERKRRARINQCIEELKDLMVNALQSEGESIAKLEKADVLELTVRHLRKLKKRNALGLTPQATYAGRFKAGYTHCAQEVSRFVTTSSIPIDVQVSTHLLSHLSGCIQAMEAPPPPSSSSSVSPPSLPSPAASAASFDDDRALDLSSSSATFSRKRQFSDDSDDSGHCNDSDAKSSWRPW